MSEKHTPQLRLGTVGWNRGFEAAGFYPEDLPEEWRLTYLSNELDCVLIPAALLDSVDRETFEEWVEDTHERFGFYTEEGGKQPSWVSELLGEQWLGNVSFEIVSDQALAAEGIDQLQIGNQVAVVEVAGELSPMAMRKLLERLKIDQVDTLLWQPGPGLVTNLSHAQTIAALLG